MLGAQQPAPRGGVDHDVSRPILSSSACGSTSQPSCPIHIPGSLVYLVILQPTITLPENSFQTEVCFLLSTARNSGSSALWRSWVSTLRKPPSVLTQAPPCTSPWAQNFTGVLQPHVSLYSENPEKRVKVWQASFLVRHITLPQCKWQRGCPQVRAVPEETERNKRS